MPNSGITALKPTTTGTKLLLVQRDIPQSVSVISQRRMQDQELNTIEQVLDNTTGVSASRVDTHRTNFYSRGFFVSNFAYEDMPTFLDNRWNFGDTAGDTAIYDKIEVVRGAAGLMSGTGLQPMSTWYVSMPTVKNLKARFLPPMAAGTINVMYWISRLR